MTRLEIIQQVTPRFSYSAYVEACKANAFEPRRQMEWAQLMGVLSAAEVTFQHEGIDTAYHKYVQIVVSEHREISPQVSVAESSSPKPCGTCGGGKVL